MTLKQDERALLQLICERNQNYEDLAGLLGIEPSEVRERARTVLEALGGTDPDADVGLTDYLLGQADHIGRADVARFLQQDPATLELATDLSAKLQALAPNATLPRLPTARGSRRSATSTARVRSGGGASATAGAGSGSDQGKTIGVFGVAGGVVLGLFATAAIVLTIVILVIAGVFSSDDEAAPATRAEDQALAGDSVTPKQTPVTETDLRPLSGSGVGGHAEFGITDQVLFVDVQVDGLAPAGNDQIYLVWLMAGDDSGFPLPTPLTPDENGSVGGQIAVPAPATQLVAPITTSVAISRTDRKELNGQIKEARDAKSPLLPFAGEKLAEGELPTTGAGVAGAGG